MAKELIHQHLPEAINRTTGAGLSLTGFSAVWGWLGTNQASITAACAIIGLLITAVGVGVTVYNSLRGKG